MAHDPRKRAEDVLRVTLHGTEVLSLMARYPKLTRTEITDVVTRVGPMRTDVERELTRLSGFKR
ncbi:MAG TPA: hypothetical protein VGP15_02530 [Burkholderiales bacterium]|jgi:uncharacterized protein (DUF433 family)|nr:hypothetical protein [Burkholderiales bacterium]